MTLRTAQAGPRRGPSPAAAGLAALAAVVGLAVGLAACHRWGGDASERAGQTPASGVHRRAERPDRPTTPEQATTAPGRGTSASGPALGAGPDRWRGAAGEPSAAAEVQARRAYLRAIRAYFAVAHAPDPGDARLRAHFTGGSLLLVVQEMAQLRRAGAAARFPSGAPPRPMVRTVQVRRSLATLRACFVDDAVVVDPVRHRALDDATRTKWVAVTMAWADGRWAVQEQRLVRAEPGAHRCG